MATGTAGTATGTARMAMASAPDFLALCFVRFVQYVFDTLRRERDLLARAAGAARALKKEEYSRA